LRRAEIEERRRPEDLTRPQMTDHLFLAFRRDLVHLHLPAQQQVQSLARRALYEELLPGRQVPDP
jgi:hypothetical protein